MSGANGRQNAQDLQRRYHCHLGIESPFVDHTASTLSEKVNARSLTHSLTHILVADPRTLMRHNEQSSPTAPTVLPFSYAASSPRP